MAMPGGLTKESAANEEVIGICVEKKGEIESKAGKKFEEYKPVSFCTQVVAGTNFFVKIDVGNGEFIHVRIYRDLKNVTSVHSVQKGKKVNDPIVYFQ